MHTMKRPRCPKCDGWLHFDGIDLTCLSCGSLYWGQATPDGVLFRVGAALWFLPRPKPAWPTGVGGSNLPSSTSRTVAPAGFSFVRIDLSRR